MWRARQRKRAELDVGMDDRWKDALMLGAIVSTIGVFVWQAYAARRQAMAEAVEYPRTYTRIPRKDTQRLAAKPDSSEEPLLAKHKPDSLALKE